MWLHSALTHGAAGLSWELAVWLHTCDMYLYVCKDDEEVC